MSFFSGLRGMMSGGKPMISEKWNIPESESDIDTILSAGTHVIYKHSFSCATCMFSKIKVEEVLEEYADKVGFHFVDVRANRTISNLIAEKTGVSHESPQAIILKGGEVFDHKSHGSITKKMIEEAFI